MKHIEITDGSYAAQWGLTDFYEKSEKILREAIESGEDFETSYGCKKEIRYADIIRFDDMVSVSVTSCMDDLFEEDDLIYDALWSRCHVEETLPDEIIQSIKDAAIDQGMNEESSGMTRLPATATFEQICDAISSLEQSTEDNNERMFNELCDIVEAHYDYIKKGVVCNG